jgi:hypothetical protein
MAAHRAGHRRAGVASTVPAAPGPACMPTREDVAEVERMLVSWFPDVPIWRGLTGWLALVTSGDGSELVRAESPVDLGWKLAVGSAHPGPLPAAALDAVPPRVNRTH